MVVRICLLAFLKERNTQNWRSNDIKGSFIYSLRKCRKKLSLFNKQLQDGNFSRLLSSWVCRRYKRKTLDEINQLANKFIILRISLMYPQSTCMHTSHHSPGCVENSNQGSVWNLATNETKMALERLGGGNLVFERGLRMMWNKPEINK